MQGIGTYETPRQFGGENRYLKFWDERGVVYLVIGGLLGLALFKALPWVPDVKRIAIALIPIVILGLIGVLRIPQESVLYGGGMRIDQVMFNIVKTKFFSPVYVKKSLESPNGAVIDYFKPTEVEVEKEMS